MQYALRVGYRPRAGCCRLLYHAPSKPVQAFGLTFKNPIGLAAGYDKDAVAIRGLAALGFGHIEVGTVTPLPQPGNPKPRIFRLIEDEAVINRMGFPSRGTEFVQNRLNSSLAPNLLERFLGFGPRRPKPIKKPIPGTVLGVNLGKNKSTPNEEAALDYLALLQNFAPLARLPDDQCQLAKHGGSAPVASARCARRFVKEPASTTIDRTETTGTTRAFAG